MLQNQQLGEAGRALADIGERLQERQDADELMRAETQIKGDYLQFEGEAKQRKGQQAWGVTKEVGEWWDQNAGKASEGITSPHAKRLFQQEVAKQRAAAVGAFSGFEAGQRRASLDESAQASIVGSINLAAANPTNPDLIATAKADILKRNQLRAQVNGWTPEMADGARTTYLTNLHKQVIQGLVRDQPEAAQAYFAANKDEIEGSQQAEVGAFAQKATATKQGETQADAVWQTLGPRSDRDPVQLDKLEQAIRESSLGDEAKKVGIAHLKERAAAFKDARHERDDALQAKVNLAVMNGSGGSQIRGMPEFLQLDGEQQRKIMDFIENRALRHEQQAAAREGREAAREARADAAESRYERRLARQGFGAYLQYSNPDVLAGMSENQVINLLPSLGNELTGHLMEKKRQLSANPGKLAEAKMDSDDFDHLARQMGLPIDDKATPDQKEAKGELRYRIEQRIAAVQQSGGKPLARDQKMQLMREEMARTVTVNPGIFSSNKDVPVIGLTRDQAQRVVIPQPDRQALSQAMQRLYQRTHAPEYEPTEDNLRRFYLLSKSPAGDLILPPKK
jgi:hypothetical protein